MRPATPSCRSPIRTHIYGRRPRRRSASGGSALLPARSSGFRQSRAHLLEILDRRTHLGGGPHRPLAPVGQPRHAGPGQPRPPPLRASRTGRTRPGTASSSRPRAARHPGQCRRRGRQPTSTASPNPLSAMPGALYILGAPSLGRPLKDNLSDPRCSAQHRPLPHRAPPGRSPSTVAAVNSRNSRRASPSRGSAGCAASSRAISTRSRTTIRRQAVRSRQSVVSGRTPVPVVAAPPRFRR